MRRFIALLCVLIALLLLLAVSLNITAQDPHDPTPVDTATPTLPRALTPGDPITEREPTLPPDVCYEPLPIELGETIYIKAGVNIRYEPNQSSAIMWNTIYDNYVTPTGTPMATDEPLVRQPPLAYPVTVTDGPVCSQGFNWWFVEGRESPGWVAEGRPDELGYYLIVLGDPPSACQPIYELEPGETADLLLDAKVRESANPNALVKTVAQAGSPVEILAGPECIGNFQWWQVRVTVVGVTYTGWMAEGSDDATVAYYLLPQDLPSTEDGTLCANPLNFVKGQEGVVEYRSGGPKALRMEPATDAQLLFTLVNGVPFIIDGGPVCSENLNWWRIRIETNRQVIGWIAEGSPGVGYWIDAVTSFEDRNREVAPPPGGTPTDVPAREREFPEPGLGG